MARDMSVDTLADEHDKKITRSDAWKCNKDISADDASIPVSITTFLGSWDSHCKTQ